MLYRKDKAFSLIFKHCWGISLLFYQIPDGSGRYLRSNALTEYMVSSLGYMVHRIESTGTWFRENGVHRFGGTRVQGK